MEGLSFSLGSPTHNMWYIIIIIIISSCMQYHNTMGLSPQFIFLGSATTCHTTLSFVVLTRGINHQAYAPSHLYYY